MFLSFLPFKATYMSFKSKFTSKTHEKNLCCTLSIAKFHCWVQGVDDGKGEGKRNIVTLSILKILKSLL